LRVYFERLWTDAAHRFRLTTENLPERPRP
jgi:hypothetical protein